MRESRSKNSAPVALFLQAVADGLQMGLLYALVAVGLAIIWGLMEMINFAHGEFMMLGMFGAWGLSVALGWDPLVSMVPIAVLMYGGGVLVYRLLMQRVQRGEVSPRSSPPSASSSSSRTAWSRSSRATTAS